MARTEDRCFGRGNSLVDAMTHLSLLQGYYMCLLSALLLCLDEGAQILLFDGER